MAMTVMAIGGAAVMTMQKTSVTGNLDARKADVANSIARTWVERLQRDSMRGPSRAPRGNEQPGERAHPRQRQHRLPGRGFCRRRRWADRRRRDDEPRL